MTKNEAGASLIKEVSVGKISIDATDPNNLSDKAVPEEETRRNFLKNAKMMGCEKEMQMLFDKYDNLLRNCTNDKERLDIAKLGVLEIYKLLGGGGELFINNELVSQ